MRAMELAITKARGTGDRLVGVRKPFTAACWLLRLRRFAKACRLASCNTPVVMALGSKTCCSKTTRCVVPFPPRATSSSSIWPPVCSQSKIYLAQTKGEDIPIGWLWTRRTANARSAAACGNLASDARPKVYGGCAVMCWPADERPASGGM